MLITDVRLIPKVVQIGPKWDKPGTFSDHISVNFGAVRQNVLKSDLKKVPDLYCAKIYSNMI